MVQIDKELRKAQLLSCASAGWNAASAAWALRPVSSCQILAEFHDGHTYCDYSPGPLHPYPPRPRLHPPSAHIQDQLPAQPNLGRVQHRHYRLLAQL